MITMAKSVFTRAVPSLKEISLDLHFKTYLKKLQWTQKIFEVNNSFPDLSRFRFRIEMDYYEKSKLAFRNKKKYS